MKLYGGIDLHSNNIVLSILDEQAHLVFEHRLPNDLKLILSELAPFNSELTGLVVESTYNWYWLVDGLMEAGYCLHLANTTAIQQYSGIKYADDITDARWLAELLRLGILKEGYIYPREERAMRDLLRKRLQLTHQRTAQLLSIQSLLARTRGRQLGGDTIKKMTQETLGQQFDRPEWALAAQSNLAVLHCLEEQIDLIEKTVLAQVKPRVEYQDLQTVNGVGKVLGLTILLETGTIHRFPGVGNYASYCRCVGSIKTSNGKKKGKVNTKNGNKYLGWAFVEAANFAIRFNPVIKAFYQRKLVKRNKIVAIKAVAHKLARACYYILRDHVPFDVNRSFG